MKVELSPCLILHHRDYRENSLLLDIFSKDHGRLDLVAKGIKRNKKQKADTYDLYQKYLLSWVAKSELGTLTYIEHAAQFSQLKPELMMLGFYINEITMRLLHKHEPHAELFLAYESILSRIQQAEDENVLLRYYECALLQALGYGIVLDYDVNTGEVIKSDEQYIYQFDYGPTNAIKNKKEANGVRISGETLLQLSTEKLSGEICINEAKHLLRSILNRHLGSKPLASRQLYQSYLRNKKVS